MLQRHENELTSRLERVMTVGIGEIRKEELKLWYGIERLTTKTWRDIESRWREVTEDYDVEHPLLVGDSHTWVFAWGEGLVPTEDSWFQDVKVLGTRAKEEVATEN